MQHITVYTMTHRQKGLDEVHARFHSLLAHLLRPDASLDLTNVSLMKQYHTQTALADTATNAQRQLVVQELLMEVKLLSRFRHLPVPAAPCGYDLLSPAPVHPTHASVHS